MRRSRARLPFATVREDVVDERSLGGRVLPTRWEMRPLAKPGNVTTIVLKDVVFDRPVDEAIFTQRNLQQP